jgi:hypothetical protein
MTTTLVPILSGQEKTVEARIRRPTMLRWRRLHPELDIAIMSSHGDYVRVRVIMKPSDLQPASNLCYMTKPQSYRAGTARGKTWWGIEVRDERGMVWLDNHESKDTALDAARQWFLVQGIDPETVTIL